MDFSTILKSGQMAGFQDYIRVKATERTLDQFIPPDALPMFMQDENYDLIAWFLQSEYKVVSEDCLELAYRNKAYKIVDLLIDFSLKENNEKFRTELLKHSRLIFHVLEAEHSHGLEFLLNYQDPTCLVVGLRCKYVFQSNNQKGDVLKRILDKVSPLLKKWHKKQDSRYESVRDDVITGVFEFADESNILPCLEIIKAYFGRSWHMLSSRSSIIVRLSNLEDICKYFDILIRLGFQFDDSCLSSPKLKPLVFTYIHTLLKYKIIPSSIDSILFGMSVPNVISYLQNVDRTLLQTPTSMHIAINNLYKMCLTRTDQFLDHRRNLFISLLEHKYRPNVSLLFLDLLTMRIDPAMEELLKGSDIKVSGHTYLKMNGIEKFLEFRHKLIERNLDYALVMTSHAEEYLQNWESQLCLRFGHNDPTAINNISKLYKGQYVKVRFLSSDMEIVYETYLQVKEIMGSQRISISNGFIIHGRSVPIKEWLWKYLPKEAPYCCKFGKLHTKLRDKTQYVRLFREIPSLVDLSILSARKLNLGKRLRNKIPGELYERVYPQWLL